MQDCYGDSARFSDPVFVVLHGPQVAAMWKMLILRGKDLDLTFQITSSNGNVVKAHWDATYTFSATGRKVINRIDGTFELENGKIIRHTDKFNFYTWARQAFGLTGWLIGWTSFFQDKVRLQAMKNLSLFMQKQV